MPRDMVSFIPWTGREWVTLGHAQVLHGEGSRKGWVREERRQAIMVASSSSLIKWSYWSLEPLRGETLPLRVCSRRAIAEPPAGIIGFATGGHGPQPGGASTQQGQELRVWDGREGARAANPYLWISCCWKQLFPRRNKKYYYSTRTSSPDWVGLYAHHSCWLHFGPCIL
jgi:hypothetical protein